MIAMPACPTTSTSAGQRWPNVSPGRRFALTDAAPTTATQRQVRATLLGGRAVGGYRHAPQARRISLELALGAAAQVGIEVTIRRGWRIFVSLAQATALLTGRALDTQLLRLTQALPILDRLPSDRVAHGEQVVSALGVNAVLPLATRLRWYWSAGPEERSVAAMTTEEAYTRGFRLQARASLLRLQPVNPAWLLAHVGLCVGVRRATHYRALFQGEDAPYASGLIQTLASQRAEEQRSSSTAPSGRATMTCTAARRCRCS
jgi:hypothetical protein